MIRLANTKREEMKCLGRDHGDGEVIILNATRHIGRSLLDQEHDRLSCERCRRARSLSTMEERKEEDMWNDEVFMIRGQSWFCNQGQEDRKTARGKFWKMLKTGDEEEVDGEETEQHGGRLLFPQRTRQKSQVLSWFHPYILPVLLPVQTVSRWLPPLLP